MERTHWIKKNKQTFRQYSDYNNSQSESDHLNLNCPRNRQCCIAAACLPKQIQPEHHAKEAEDYNHWAAQHCSSSLAPDCKWQSKLQGKLNLICEHEIQSYLRLESLKSSMNNSQLTPLIPAPACCMACSSVAPRKVSNGVLLFFFDRSLSCLVKCSVLDLVTSSTLCALNTCTDQHIYISAFGGNQTRVTSYTLCAEHLP